MTDITKEEIYKIFEKISKQNDFLANQVESLNEEFRSYKIKVETRIEDLENPNEGLKLENATLEDRLLSCERRSKKYNLVIYNLPGENIHESVVNLLRQKVNIDCREANILSKANNLKGTGIFIAPDYVAEDYQLKKKIFQYQKLARQQGHTVTIKGNSLIIDGVLRSIEEIQLKELAYLPLDNHTKHHRNNSVSSTASSASNKRTREGEEDIKHPKRNLRSNSNI